jgi:hypothetical protein
MRLPRALWTLAMTLFPIVIANGVKQPRILDAYYEI